MLLTDDPSGTLAHSVQPLEDGSGPGMRLTTSLTGVTHPSFLHLLFLCGGCADLSLAGWTGQAGLVCTGFPPGGLRLVAVTVILPSAPGLSVSRKASGVLL